MDPGGTTSNLLEDPEGSVDALARARDLEIPHLRAAREHTKTRLKELSESLPADEVAPDLSIVVFGSWARRELTEHSDDDYAVLSRVRFEADDADVCRALLAARRELGREGKQPGSQDVFGGPFDIETLVERVGLDADSNTNLTRRILLLLESREVAGSIHRPSWERILERYLDRGVKARRPPRFLLNDLVRYWRTVCVDFEGKHADEGDDDPKWASRNAKLRTSRKLVFAGGLLPILLCHRLDESEIREFLPLWLARPPLDRLAASFLLLDAVDEGMRALAAYDDWIAVQQDGDKREELESISRENREVSPLFQEIRDIGKRFEAALLALLFDTELGPTTRRYAIF